MNRTHKGMLWQPSYPVKAMAVYWQAYGNHRASHVHDVNPYIPTLAINGPLVMVGYLGPLEPALNSAPLVLSRKAVAGSLIGGIAETQEMLDFCGQHDITSDIELIDIATINDAYERMLKSDVKYRFVIDIAPLKS